MKFSEFFDPGKRVTFQGTVHECGVHRGTRSDGVVIEFETEVSKGPLRFIFFEASPILIDGAEPTPEGDA